MRTYRLPNYNYLSYAKAKRLDLTVCIVVNVEKFRSPPPDLDLDRTMPNVELARAIFIIFMLSCV